MLLGTECKKILNSLVAQGATEYNGQNTQNRLSMLNAHLALFTTLPDSYTGANGVEVSLSGYHRRLIKGLSLDGTTYMFGTSAAWDNTASAYIISNSGSIQMHAIDENVSTVVSVLGFGIYATDENGIERLVLWGPLIDDNGDPVVANDTAPTLTGGSVPIFQPEDFKLVFSGTNNSNLCADWCTNILNTLVNCHVDNQDKEEYILDSIDAKLGLFTTLPNAQGQNGDQVPTTSGYTQKELWGYSLAQGSLQFSIPAVYSVNPPQYSIMNTDEIQMHSLNRNLIGSYTIKGFGIWGGTTPSLLAWGPLVDENEIIITVLADFPQLSAGSVPIFYPNKFKLMLYSGESGGVPVSSVSITADPNRNTFNSFTDEITLTTTITPNNATDQTVNLRAEDTEVVTLINNKITPGIKPGSTNIIAYAADNKTATFAITSEYAKPTSLGFKNNNLQKITSANVKRYTGSGAPSNSQYLTTIYVDYIPVIPIPSANKQIIASSSSSDVVIITNDSSLTDLNNGKVTFYSKTSAGVSSTLTIKLYHDQSISAQLPITTIA